MGRMKRREEASRSLLLSDLLPATLPPPPTSPALNYSYFLFEVWNTGRSPYGGESIINLSAVMALKTTTLHSIH